MKKKHKKLLTWLAAGAVVGACAYLEHQQRQREFDRPRHRTPRPRVIDTTAKVK